MIGEEAWDNNYLVGVVLVDLSRAFDSISHYLLLCKMDRYEAKQSSGSRTISVRVNE